MKAAMFRKDGMGAVVGRLKSPNEIQYENQGKLMTFTLTGNVVDTEYNDVVVVGNKIDEDTFFVQSMESLPKENEDALELKGEGVDGPIHCLAVPIEMIIDAEIRKNDNGKSYRALRIADEKNSTIFLTVFGEYCETPINYSMVFLLVNPLNKTEKAFGEGYAVKKQIVKSGIAYQVMS